MMTDKLLAVAVLDEPRVAVRAAHAVAAGAAERERRVTTPVEKQERLFVAGDRLADLALELRRDPALLRRSFGAQVDRFKRRDGAAAEPLGQREPLIAPAP